MNPTLTLATLHAAAGSADDARDALLRAAADAGPLVGLLVIDIIRDATTLAQRIRHVADALAAEEKEAK